MDDPKLTLKARYDILKSNRTTVLERARANAKYTLHSLLPPEGATTSTKLKVTYSSYGARCVNSLASKLVLTLFPPKAPFFRLVLPDEVLESVGADKAMKAEIDKALATMEARAAEEIEISMARPTGLEALKHLIVAGNVLVHMQADNSLKLYALPCFVVKRDPEGNLIEAIAVEKISAMELPPEVRDAIAAKDPKRVDSADDSLELYTGLRRTETGFDVFQECEGIEITGSRGTYNKDTLPWMALRWTAVPGEDYGRSHVEDYLGDIVNVEGLTAAINKGAAAMAKLVFLVKPGSVTKKATIAKAETGDVVDGIETDVTTLQSNKSHDFAVAQQVRAETKQDLAYAFLLNHAIQRDAERVTAEEIRFMANELDSTLGGIYSALSVEFQLPYVRRLLTQLQRQKKLPSLPKGSVKPVIVTGMEALGRGAELDRLRMLVKDIVELGGPEALSTYLHFDNLLTRLATARGVPTEGLVKSKEEVAAEQQAAQQQALVETLGPNAVNQAGNIATAAMKNGGQGG